MGFVLGFERGEEGEGVGASVRGEVVVRMREN